MENRTKYLVVFVATCVGAAFGIAACVGDDPSTGGNGDGADGGDGSSSTDAPANDQDQSTTSTDSGKDSGTSNPTAPVAIATGASHACVLRADHKVLCWGDATTGELGPAGAGLTSSALPLTVPFPAGVNPVAIFAGTGFSCIVDDAAGVWCWGSDGLGQLGNDGDGGIYLSPVQVHGPSGNFAGAPLPGAASTGGSPFACMIAADKSVACMGTNGNGALGSAGPNPHAVAATIPDTPVLELAAGWYHSSAIVTHGGQPTVAQWGDNFYGQSGTLDGGFGSAAPIYTSLPDGGVPASIVAGDYHVCALDTSGGLSCWGGNSRHQVGPNAGGAAKVYQPTPDSDFASDKIIGLTAGGFATCAILASGDVYCFGDNTYGQLANNGVGASSAARVQIVGIDHDAIAIAAGTNFICAIRQSPVGDRSVWCWGSNQSDQLGSPDAGSTCGAPCSPAPIQVPLPAD